MGPQSGGGNRGRLEGTGESDYRSIHQGGKTRGGINRLVETSKGQHSYSDDSSSQVERLDEQATEEGRRAGGLTGLGIRILHPNRSKSFLFLGDDDDDEDDGDEELKSDYDPTPRRLPRVMFEDKSDTVSIASTCPEIDLAPIVNAFPSPPIPDSLQPPPSLASPLLLNSSAFDFLPQLHHRPSVSTIASELTLASTISSSSSLETPSASPRAPSVAEPVPAAVPRPNAAKLRRVRSFAKPVSVYFSPDRPPALPLPCLPPSDSTPSTPTTPSLTVPPFDSPSLSASSTDPSTLSSLSHASSPTIQTPYGFYAPSYGRIARKPPSAPPPDRPLPSLPPLSDQSATRDSRLFLFPSHSREHSANDKPNERSLPPLSQASSSPTAVLAESALVENDGISGLGRRPRSCSIGSDSSTPTIKTPSLSSSTASTSSSDQFIDLLTPQIHSSRSSPNSTKQSRTRLTSNNSVASLDISQISLELSLLASNGTTTTTNSSSSSTSRKVQVSEAKGGIPSSEKTEKEIDRERVRRLISRVSSVIEMRKLSMASHASCDTRSSTASSVGGGGGGGRGGGDGKSGYKAYKLVKKPSLSPSNSFASFAGTRSPCGGGTTTASGTNRSRTSSYDDSDSESSASEEMFDLSFDSQLLSPPSVNLLPGEDSESPLKGGAAAIGKAHARRSQVPPRWAGRRRSSATTIEEEDDKVDDRLERRATKRADETFGKKSAGSRYEDGADDEEEEELQEQLEELPWRRELKSVASNESFQTRIGSPATIATTTTRTLRSISSVPLLRNSSIPGSPLSRPSTYSMSPLRPNSPKTTTTGLRPLITSSPPQARRSFIPSPSSSPRIPLIGFSRNPTYSPVSSPQFTDPFSSSPTLRSRQSVSALRKSSLPIPSSFSQPTSPGPRKVPAPAQLDRRKSSLAALSYNSASPSSGPHAGTTKQPKFGSSTNATSSTGSRIAQPSFTTSPVNHRR